MVLLMKEQSWMDLIGIWLTRSFSHYLEVGLSVVDLVKDSKIVKSNKLKMPRWQELERHLQPFIRNTEVACRSEKVLQQNLALRA